jgi:hypothetical protein
MNELVIGVNVEGLERGILGRWSKPKIFSRKGNYIEGGRAWRKGRVFFDWGRKEVGEQKLGEQKVWRTERF